MQKPELEVCLSPALLHLYDTENTNVVIIDIFRATSTISAALHNGAKAIYPVDNIEECINAVQLFDNCISAGERNGKVAPGLQYGNSPLEYPRDFIENKILALTTTNGTKLLHMVKSYAHIITGSFLNISTVADFLIQENKKVLLACAAWKNRVNLEDALFAGTLIEKIKSSFEINCDSARLTQHLYQQAIAAPSFISFLENSSHYNRLAGYGLIKDMEYCLQQDLHPVLPIYQEGFLVAHQ